MLPGVALMGMESEPFTINFLHFHFESCAVLFLQKVHSLVHIEARRGGRLLFCFLSFPCFYCIA